MSEQIEQEKSTYKAIFFGPFWAITNKKEILYEIEGRNHTIHQMILQIIKDFPKLEEYFFEGDNIADNTSIIINGEDVRGGDGLNTIISPDDRITFFKAAGGG
ncbi:MAG: MoaD/ThiS family protein [Promethearchaeota archaeon]